MARLDGSWPDTQVRTIVKKHPPSPPEVQHLVDELAFF
jgi:hypothetical protein